MENEIEDRPPALGREHPTDDDVQAIQLGVRRFGLAGLVNRTGVNWSIVAGAGFSQPVKAESLHVLRQALETLNLYQRHLEQVAI